MNAMMLAQKFDAAEAAHFVPLDALAGEPPFVRPNLAGPFPNLRCQQIVREIVEAVIDTTNFCKMTDGEAYHLTLGIIRGARIVVSHDGDEDGQTEMEREHSPETERFVLELLQQLNEGGVKAIRELVAVVMGREPCALQ